MNCTATGQPRPTVTWRKDGAEVHSVVAKYAVTRFGILTISNLEVEDTGSYTCTASNTVGRDYHEQTLKVQVPPKITEAPKNQEVVINGNIYLTCSAFGIPTPTITWTRNGKYIKTNPGANGKSFVTINDVEGSNAGIYKCTAENVAGRASASATVLIKSPPRVTVPDGDAFVTVAEKVILTCSVGGDPTADIRWLKNGRPVRFSNRIKLLTNGSLLILDSTSSDAGLYKCVASNDAGISEGIAMLTVNEPPAFKIEPINMRINEGDTTIMNCVAEGEPTPTISWLRGWDDLVPDGHISILPNNSLRIIGTQLSDSGIYRCKASNNLGITIVEASITVVVHGRFSPWTTWGICSSTCGVGVQFRTRSCDNPPPQNGGRSCTGSVLDSKTCVSGHCPVDGQWGNWLLWEECSTTCGNGERRRTRVCDNPQPQHGGKPCNGNSSEVETCSVRMCSVNGNWGSWSNWSLCSVSCGDGIQERTRECDNPAPQYGGQACQGDRKDKKSCSTQDCAVDGTWGQWSVWSSCSQSCGGGSKNRSRLCDSPRPMYGGSPCVGRNVQVDYCNPEPCPVNGNWSPWGSWGDCSASCDRAHRKRFRSCSNPSPSINGRMCVGASEDSQTCNTSPCPVNGVWEQWGPWLPCSQTCDKGYRERKRTCRVPQHGGQNCVGNNIQRDECLLQACSRNPLQANGNILGVIGGVEINEGKLSAVISPSVNGTGVNVNATISNVPQTVAKHLRYLVSVINPVYWTVAQEIDGAYNGFSLTDGKFSREVQVEFVTGEVLQMTQYVSGVDKNGVLQVDVIVRGNVPNLPPNSEIQLLPYRESYVQTGKGNVYAYSSRAFRVNGHILPYAWNHTITYETDRLMPVLVETLYTRDMNVILDTTGRKVHFTLHSSIGPGIPSNQCPQGFSLNSEGQFCTDIDECQKSESCSHYCHNSPGKYSCSCPLGFLLDMLGRNCIDVDECKTNNGGCSDGYDCVNTEGSSHCVIVCATGYMRHPNNRSCIDIDECKDNPGVCGQHCVNVPGSYKCSCSDGFRLTENGRCTDLNECRTRSSSCSHICRNSIGSYWCTCPAGYRLIDKYNCIDIDECGEGTHRCSDSQDCVNVKGSYRCVQRCPLGFKKINGACTDVDECLERIDRCYSNQQCINSEGSYYCQCEKGYRSRGPGTPCLDIDECQEDKEICQHNCTNKVGSYACTCPPGYKVARNGRNCIDINECLDPSIDCGTGKMCFNKRGDFSCIDTPCPLTYKRDPQTNYCVLECVDAEQPCPPGARYADVIEFRTLALPSGIVAHQDLIRLTAYNQDDIKLPKTDFYILENDPKISFQLRLVDGTGILYTLRPLVETETYQIKVRAKSYDYEEEYLQYQTTFMIHISVSAYPY